MTETTIVDETETEVAGDPPPFLRITGTYPTTAGLFETIQLELNLGDGDPIADYDTGPQQSTEVTSWITEFCIGVIAEMRRNVSPNVRITNFPAGLSALLKHAENCDGNCGQQLPLLGDPAGVPFCRKDGK